MNITHKCEFLIRGNKNIFTDENAWKMCCSKRNFVSPVGKYCFEVRYVSTIRTKKISLHSRRDDSSNWYERLNESDNIDNAKICVMNTIDKGKASFWQRYCCVYTRASLAIISVSSHLLKLITQYVKTCPRFSLIPAHRFYSIVSYCNLTQSDR